MVLAMLTLSGCSKEVTEAVNKGVEDVKQKVGGAAEAVGERLDADTQMELELAEPADTPGCYVALARPGDGRPSVLRLASYKDPGEIRYPAIFLHAVVNAEGVEDLKDEELAGELFYQSSEQSAVWRTSPEAPARLAVTKIDGRIVAGEFTGGTLVNVQTSEEVPLKGSFSGALP
jgi:hypothetical protein